jgi:hypothetical protein
VAPPQPDTPHGVSRGKLYAKIDELRLDNDRKGDTGLDVADQLDRCRGDRPSSPPTPGTQALTTQAGT